MCYTIDKWGNSPRDHRMTEMLICDIKDGMMVPRTKKSFEGDDQRETCFLRPLLRRSIEGGALEDILPGLMVIGEEINAWDDSDRRIDILAVDRDANVVVIEVKRTNHGGHAELQVIRYAAMIEEMTFDNAAEALHVHMKNNGNDGAKRSDAEDALLDFFDWNAPDAGEFGTKTRCVIISAGFSKELMTAVAHLVKMGESITCLQVEPFDSGDGDPILAVNIVKTNPPSMHIKFASAPKKQTGTPGRRGPRAKYFVKVGDEVVGASLSKRDTVMAIVRAVVNAGHSPAKINSLVKDMLARSTSMFEVIDEVVSAKEFKARITDEVSADKANRFCCESDGDLFVHDGKTYALSNQWGRDTDVTMNELLAACKNTNVTFGRETDGGIPPADAGRRKAIDK